MAISLENMIQVIVAPPYGHSNPCNINLLPESNPYAEVLKNNREKSWYGLYNEMGEEWMEKLDKMFIKSFYDKEGRIDHRYHITFILSFKC